MAGAGLLALIDDISTLLDDVSLLTKVAAKKTAGVLGDDLALNAEQVSGVRAERELPVVWAVAKGSFKNKLFLVPAALLLSAFLPWLITPLLMLGGLFLCFEGFEKIAHKFLPHSEEDHESESALLEGLQKPGFDLMTFEREKIKGAIRTDFILSAEIVVITLGTVQAATLNQQILTLSLIALAMTLGVYGLVAGIVKLDDAGLYLHRASQNGGSAWQGVLGKGLLQFCPYLMRGLSILGTAAMFLVGGGILVHGLPIAHELYHSLSHMAPLAILPAVLSSSLFNAIAGVLAGALVLVFLSLIKTLLRLAKQ